MVYEKHIKNFCIRGATFAWSGPVILAIVWLVLQAAGVVTTLTVNEVALGIVSMTIMAFLAAGVSIVYQIESLPKAFAGLIQMSVLYLDYLGFYLLNGWIPWSKIWIFTAIFVVAFALVWFIIYITVRVKVGKMNRSVVGENRPR